MIALTIVIIPFHPPSHCITHHITSTKYKCSLFDLLWKQSIHLSITVSIGAVYLCITYNTIHMFCLFARRRSSETWIITGCLYVQMQGRCISDIDELWYRMNDTDNKDGDNEVDQHDIKQALCALSVFHNTPHELLDIITQVFYIHI
jgi:hypothetical protein